MAEKKSIIKEKVEHSGLFDFPAFYSFAHSWFKESGYGVTEDKYAEKIEGNKRDISIEWKISRGISDYFKSEYKVKFEISGLTEVEVEIDGERKKMNKGKVSIDITGNLISDPEGKWESSPFYKFIRDVYNKFIIPARVERMESLVREDVVDFKEEIKSFLELSGKR
ncbi:hypothetical protein HY450_02525 [Candidatus Pacearchaeota archaeon]|nr:hypothetical protein [Candidatus Pacearchaeota archaeon]